MRLTPNSIKKIDRKNLRHLHLKVITVCCFMALMAAPDSVLAAKPQQLIWSEDYQNIDSARTDFTSLLNYSGLTPAGQQYTANANWLP